MKEKTVLVGESKNLVGVVTNPLPKFEGQDRPAIILLNSGLLHRVGPNRVYVKLARKLAEDGFIVLRFDLSGIGDSRVPNDGQTYDESARVIKDIQDVMNYLSATRGARKFILMGLCSGGSNAFRAACHDERVVGVNLIEGFAFPSTGYFASSYSSSFLSPRSWWRLFTGESEVWGLLRGLFKFHTSKQTRQLSENLHVPSKESLLADFNKLLKRQVNLYFICTDIGAAYYNYKAIFEEEFERLPAHQKPRLEIVKDTDHLFTLLHHQEMLIKLVRNWAGDFVENEKVSEVV